MIYFLKTKNNDCKEIEVRIGGDNKDYAEIFIKDEKDFTYTEVLIDDLETMVKGLTTERNRTKKGAKK